MSGSCFNLFCDNDAVFGLSGDNPIYCLEHMEPEMKMCYSFDSSNQSEDFELDDIIPDVITKSPDYNIFTNPIPIPDPVLDSEQVSVMIPESKAKIEEEPVKNPEFIHRLCSFRGCVLPGLYSYIRRRKTFCEIHKLPAMVKRKTTTGSNLCEARDCVNKACFGFITTEIRQRCFDHKLDGMVDLIRRSCTHEGCGKYAVYRDMDGVLKFCKEHPPKDGLFSFKHSSFCIEGTCLSVASYGFPRQQRLYCRIHKKDGMVHNMKKRKIVFSEFSTKYRKKYQ